MGARNAFCGIMNRPNGTFLYFIPEKEGGQNLRFEDVDEYLSHLRINYDKIAVSKIITERKQEADYCLSPSQLQKPIDEVMLVKIDSERKKATCKFFPPSQGGQLLTKEEIIKRLNMFGVRYGAVEETIDHFLQKHIYCTELVLAKALLPVEGTSAKIIYHFNTDTNVKPKVNEDGSVDFHNLNTFNLVKKGDVLATLIPADEGRPGIDIFGNVLKQQKVNRLNLKFGNKITMNEAGTEITSDVNGHVFLVENRVFVSDVMEIPSDVGPSTGDVIYEGSVQVKGNVLSGYRIQAKGDITVEGIVESADLISDGQIILMRGIQGGGRGNLQAGTNIIAKFIESANVKCNGYIQADAIMHSKVSARGEIIVSGKKGFITGGEIHSGTSITAKTAGNNLETKTVLEVGIDPALVEEFRVLEKSVPQMTEEIEKLGKIVEGSSKRLKSGERFDARLLNLIKESIKKKEELEKQLEIDMDRFMTLTVDMEDKTEGKIIIHGSIHPGCRIIISNVRYYVKSEIVRSRFIREGADIRVTAL